MRSKRSTWSKRSNILNPEGAKDIEKEKIT